MGNTCYLNSTLQVSKYIAKHVNLNCKMRLQNVFVQIAQHAFQNCKINNIATLSQHFRFHNLEIAERDFQNCFIRSFIDETCLKRLILKLDVLFVFNMLELIRLKYNIIKGAVPYSCLCELPEIRRA